MTVIQMTQKKPVFKNEKNNKEIQQIVECQIRYTQFTYESPTKVLIQLTDWLKAQSKHHIKELLTLASIFEIYDIVTVGYDEDSLESTMQGIKSGKLEPSKWNQFVIDRNLAPIWPVYKRVTQDGVTTVTIM